MITKLEINTDSNGNSILTLRSGSGEKAEHIKCSLSDLPDTKSKGIHTKTLPELAEWVKAHGTPKQNKLLKQLLPL